KHEAGEDACPITRRAGGADIPVYHPPTQLIRPVLDGGPGRFVRSPFTSCVQPSFATQQTTVWSGRRSSAAQAHRVTTARTSRAAGGGDTRRGSVRTGLDGGCGSRSLLHPCDKVW